MTDHEFIIEKLTEHRDSCIESMRLKKIDIQTLMKCLSNLRSELTILRRDYDRFAKIVKLITENYPKPVIQPHMPDVERLAPGQKFFRKNAKDPDKRIDKSTVRSY